MAAAAPLPLCDFRGVTKQPLWFSKACAACQASLVRKVVVADGLPMVPIRSDSARSRARACGGWCAHHRLCTDKVVGKCAGARRQRVRARVCGWAWHPRASSTHEPREPRSPSRPAPHKLRGDMTVGR